MKKIDISTEKYPDVFALVDDEDYERINKYKWHAIKTKWGWYAMRAIYVPKMKSVKLYMAKEILRYVGGKEVDHKNHNTLDNQKSNLRLCTSSQNSMNTRIRTDNVSGYKGVYFHRLAKKWLAQIVKDKKNYYLGLYNNKHDAGKAYNKKAKELFGEFAHLNKIEEIG